MAGLVIFDRDCRLPPDRGSLSNPAFCRHVFDDQLLQPWLLPQKPVESKQAPARLQFQPRLALAVSCIDVMNMVGLLAATTQPPSDVGLRRVPGSISVSQVSRPDLGIELAIDAVNIKIGHVVPTCLKR